MIGALLKAGVSGVVSYGVGYTIGNIAGAVTPENAKTAQKVCVWVASMVIGSMVEDAAQKHMKEKATEISDAVKEMKKKFDSKKAVEEET